MASVALSEAEKVYIVHGVQVAVAAVGACHIVQGGGAGRPRDQDGRPGGLGLRRACIQNA